MQQQGNQVWLPEMRKEVRLKELVGWVVLVSIAIFVILFGLLTVAGTVSCDNLEQVTGYETKYDLIGGCYMNVDGQWIPSKKWIYNSGN